MRNGFQPIQQKPNLNGAIFLNVLKTIVALVAISYGQESGDPTNLLTGNLQSHDPSSVIKDGNRYYVYQTGGGFQTSIDRINWAQGGRVFSANPTWWLDHITPSPLLWAGDISFWNGKFYYYYSVSAWNNFNSCIGLATNETLDPQSPKYKWVDEGVIVDALTGTSDGKKVNVIDPSLFQDTDGRKYLNYGSFNAGMRQVEIDPATGKRMANPPKPTVISDHLGEASFLIKIKDYYYYTSSRGSCCNGMNSTYQVVYGRSNKVSGPFTTKTGTSMVTSNYDILLAGDKEHPGQGGQSFFVDHDSLFMVYHAYTAPSGKSMLNIRPVYLDKSNWLTMDPAKGEIVKVLATTGLVKSEDRPIQHQSHFTKSLMSYFTLNGRWRIPN
jgi:arabinan endo-1,5-alpha-L-arabinosidase